MDNNISMFGKRLFIVVVIIIAIVVCYVIFDILRIRSRRRERLALERATMSEEAMQIEAAAKYRADMRRRDAARTEQEAKIEADIEIDIAEQKTLIDKKITQVKMKMEAKDAARIRDAEMEEFRNEQSAWMRHNWMRVTSRFEMTLPDRDDSYIRDTIHAPERPVPADIMVKMLPAIHLLELESKGNFPDTRDPRDGEFIFQIRDKWLYGCLRTESTQVSICPVSAIPEDVQNSVIISGAPRRPEFDGRGNLHIGFPYDGNLDNVRECLAIVQYSALGCRTRVFYITNWKYLPVYAPKRGLFWLPMIACPATFVAHSNGYMFISALLNLSTTINFKWRLSRDAAISWDTPLHKPANPQMLYCEECKLNWGISDDHKCWRQLEAKSGSDIIHQAYDVAYTIRDLAEVSIGDILDPMPQQTQSINLSVGHAVAGAWWQLCLLLTDIGIKMDADAVDAELRRKELHRIRRERTAARPILGPVRAATDLWGTKQGGLLSIFDSILKLLWA